MNTDIKFGLSYGLSKQFSFVGFEVLAMSSCLACSSTLKMEAVHSSEKSVRFTKLLTNQTYFCLIVNSFES
jgi:hypothetical protein